MKVRDSGMPEEERWSSFFSPETVLGAFGLDRGVATLVDFGCGYGTFTLAAAKLVSGTVHALDIEPEMIETVRAKCRQEGLANVRTELRDFVKSGSGLADSSVDAALLFNILHHDDPVVLMGEAWRILRPGGRLAVVHWNYDPATPRGPALEIRPRPEQCIEWGRTVGFGFVEEERFDLRPYHYGLLFRKAVPDGRRA
ncbi:MAG TPA: class I SAM-dependent methyltransferase [Deferrimonas sp.]|jgi:SAM-dependent methyltransferase